MSTISSKPMTPISPSLEPKAPPSSPTGVMGGRAVTPVKEILTDWQQCKQLFKMISSIVLTLGLGFISSTFRHTVEQWWNEIKTGERTLEQWPTSSLPADAQVAHQLGQMTIGQVEEFIVLEGKLNEGKMDGPGKIAYPDGTLLEGTFVKGLLQGQGKKTMPDGIMMEGNFIDGFLQGKAKMTYPSASHGQPHLAYGIFKDGELIELLDSPPEPTLKYGGKVVIHESSGIIEEGHFDENNQLTGLGKKTLPNGAYFEGEFLKGQLHGKGKKVLANGTVHEGQFEKNMLTGQGKITYDNGDIYEGIFDGDVMQGLGTQRFKDGTLAEGMFENNVIVEGKQTLPDKRVLEGVFDLGSFEKGTIFYPDGTREDGIFSGLALNGYGRRYMPEGGVLEGRFEDGILVKAEPIPPEILATFIKPTPLTIPSDDEIFFEKEEKPLKNYFLDEKDEIYNDKINFDAIESHEEYHNFIKPYEENLFSESKNIEDLKGYEQKLLPDGTLLQGVFEGGHLVKGRVTYPTYIVEEGSFNEAGQLHGKGIRTLPTGDTFEGIFKNGLLNGYGKVTIGGGVITMEGNFVDGVKIS